MQTDTNSHAETTKPGSAQTEPTQLATIDTIWQEVARHLGNEWRWTRTRPGETQPETRCGWLRESEALSLWISFSSSRWEIHHSLDAIIAPTGERIFVRDLYASSESQPTTAITLARSRSARDIARDISRRLLPSALESQVRMEVRRGERTELATRRQHALEAIRRVCPSAHLCDPRASGAPRLFVDRLSLDLRIDDANNITITRWSGLILDTTLRVLAAALSDTPS